MEKVDLSPLVSLFHDFFTSVYKEKVNSVLLNYPTKRSIEVDYLDLEKFDPELADKLVKDPDVVISAAEEAISEMNLTIPTGQRFAPHARFHNMMSNETMIEHIGSKSINEMVYFKGVVTRRAEVMHRVKVAVYKCQLCDSEIRLFVGKNFVPPKRCD
ncbi:TPA: minichromosome maintenance protein MCM, partial [Candidatus Micrarchaeota archaeon]|nr:minichromosome maintenance protein MCM [Candidatus Micrarchaeota archaeon]